MSLYFAFVITSKSLGFAPLNKSLLDGVRFEPRPDNCSQIFHALLEESLVSTRAVTARNTFVLELSAATRRHLAFNRRGVIFMRIVVVVYVPYWYWWWWWWCFFLLCFFFFPAVLLPRRVVAFRKGLLFRMHHFKISSLFSSSSSMSFHFRFFSKTSSHALWVDPA